MIIVKWYEGFLFIETYKTVMFKIIKHFSQAYIIK